jgi:hypothetical protein
MEYDNVKLPFANVTLRGKGNYSLIHINYPQSPDHYRHTIYNETLRVLGILVDLTDDGDQSPETATKAGMSFIKSLVAITYTNNTLVEASSMNSEEAYAINTLYCPKLTIKSPT